MLIDVGDPAAAGTLRPLDDEDFHRVRLEGDAEVPGIGGGGDHGLELVGIDEFDTVIASEGLALDLEPVVVRAGVAFERISDERLSPSANLPFEHR
jgi:hypothetical protein